MLLTRREFGLKLGLISGASLAFACGKDPSLGPEKGPMLHLDDFNPKDIETLSPDGALCPLKSLPSDPLPLPKPAGLETRTVEFEIDNPPKAAAALFPFNYDSRYREISSGMGVYSQLITGVRVAMPLTMGKDKNLIYTLIDGSGKEKWGPQSIGEFQLYPDIQAVKWYLLLDSNWWPLCQTKINWV